MSSYRVMLVIIAVAASLLVLVSASSESQSRDNLVDAGDAEYVESMTTSEPSFPALNQSDWQLDDGNANQSATNESSIFKWLNIDMGCGQWLPINHIYFQLANGFLLLSYLAPAGIYGLIYLRGMLAIGSAFFSIWGWLILCAFDTFAWNALFTIINVVHGIVLVFSLRPVRFDKQVEEVYKCVFQPLKVSKQQFKKVVNCLKSIRPLKKGEYFAVEKQTKVETLSLLLSGRMNVTENGKTLHVLTPMQFLDSPEWFGMSSDDIFQASVRACEESRVLLWHRDKLKLILLSDPFLQAVFDHVLGRDVVRKLTQMKETMADGNQLRNRKMKGACDTPEKSATNAVHEHGRLIVAPESLLLLDEDRSKVSARLNDNAPFSGRHNRYDYSIVEHLDSTDI